MSKQQLNMDCTMVSVLHDLVGAIKQVGSGSLSQPVAGGQVGGDLLQVDVQVAVKTCIKLQ